MVGACAWKSDKDLVPEDQIECLLSLLLEAEKRTWLASISPVNLLERDDGQPADEENGKRKCSSLDAGFQLLGYGRCIDQIHNYFHCFEPNHYCLKATTNTKSPERFSSQMKVVSHDNSPTHSTRTSSTVSLGARETTGLVNDKHPLFELYKNVLLCAKYPVLSLSQTASPTTAYSPTLSPNMSSVPPDTMVPALPVSTEECVSPEVSFTNLSDDLQELVMNIFPLTRKQHKYLCDTIIPQKVPQARDPRKLLIETLLSQRAVLERNHHPFYSVQAFMDKNAYSEWVMLEKEKIESLIKRFWHKACPPVCELPLEDHEFHKQYVNLMKRLIRFESKNDTLHPVHDGVTPTSPLSRQACCLLREFQLRYGIGLLFCSISYLDYLVKYLEYDLWYLQHVGCCLQGVMGHVTCPEIFVESEFKMLVSLLSDLLNKTKYALTRIRKIFPANSSKDGVPALVALFKLSLESKRHLQSEFPVFFAKLYPAQVFACNLATEPLGDILASYLKTEMQGRYERLKIIALDELNQDFLSPRLIIKLILEIRQEVKEYNTFYSETFSSYFDVMELAAIQLYSLLMSDVEQLCANPPRARKGDDVEPNMLCLAFRLSKLDKDWSKFIPASHQIWRQPFQNFAQQWLDAIGRFFQALVPQMTCQDGWKAAEVNFTVSQERYHTAIERRPVTQGLMGARTASLQSLRRSQHSAFNTVHPSSSGSAKTMNDRISVGRPQSTIKSPKRPQPALLNETSSDGETPIQGIPCPPKTSQVRTVVVQIHEPKAKCIKNEQQQQQQLSHEDGTSAHAHESLGHLQKVLITVRGDSDCKAVHRLKPGKQAKPSPSEPCNDQRCQKNLQKLEDENNGPMIENAAENLEPKSTEDFHYLEKEQKNVVVPSYESVHPNSGTVVPYAQKEIVQDVPEEVYKPGYPGHFCGPRTPFENDSTEESDRETFLPFLPSSEISCNSASYRQAPQEDCNDGEMIPSTRSTACNATLMPLAEESSVSSKGQSNSHSCERCPGKDISFGNDQKRGQNRVVGSAGSSDVNAAHWRCSAPINISPSRPHKLITRLRDNSGGSIGSTLSGESFVTAPESIESFHSVCSKTSSLQSQHSKCKGNGANHSETLCATQAYPSTTEDPSAPEIGKPQSDDNAPQCLPISSSFVDVLCAVNRLASFVSHLCEILCTDGCLQKDQNVDDVFRVESLATKRQLCHKLVQVIHSFVKLYSDSVLAFETCGLPEDVLAEILDDRLQRHLTLEREAGHLRGCRYNPLSRQCCNTSDSFGRFVPPCEGMTRTDANPGQYEQLTQEMGVRISNVAILRSILPWLSEHAVTAVDSPVALLSAHDCVQSGIESVWPHSLSYCEYGPSLDGVTNHLAAKVASCDAPKARMDELLDQVMLNDELDHLCRLQTAQVKLVAYRISKFFEKVLRCLLNLNLPRYDMRKRLKPAMDFLTCELRRFHCVLYPDCFKKLLTNIWVAVAETFKVETLSLVKRGSSAAEHSKLLVQAVAYLMQFFHAGGIGLACDKLASALDSTMKGLQLYANRTDKLITMYYSLYKQVPTTERQYRADDFASSVSVSSHHCSASAPEDFIFQALHEDLHTFRKCFTGAQLVEWVKGYVRKNDLKDFGVCVGTTETETGVELGQYMLDHGMIICISSPPLFNQQPTCERRKQTKGERGKVFISDAPPLDIRVNDISVTTLGSRSSSPTISCSSSQSSTTDDSESQREADDEYEGDDDLVCSASHVSNRTSSALSERSTTFYNDHNAFYKFISEEDSSRTEIKIRLGISDRLNLGRKLKNILCVLYTRKDSDRRARNFLKRLPRDVLDQAIHGESDAMCYGVFGICQTLEEVLRIACNTQVQEMPEYM